MNYGGLRSRDLRHCSRCGRPLETHETCECGRAVPGTRDGLRAACPQFQARSSYRRRHYLNCGGHKLLVGSLEDRDAMYAEYCCGDHEKHVTCPFWGHRVPAMIKKDMLDK